MAHLRVKVMLVSLLVLHLPVGGHGSVRLTRRRYLSGNLATFIATAASRPALARSRSEVLSNIAVVLIAQKRIRTLQQAFAADPFNPATRATATLTCKGMFKELELERNVQGVVTFTRSAEAKDLARDALEFLSSVVSFDGFDSFDEKTNERLVTRETTPEKLEYVHKAVDRAAQSLDAFIRLVDQAAIQEANILVERAQMA